MSFDVQGQRSMNLRTADINKENDFYMNTKAIVIHFSFLPWTSASNILDFYFFSAKAKITWLWEICQIFFKSNTCTSYLWRSLGLFLVTLVFFSIPETDDEPSFNLLLTTIIAISTICHRAKNFTDDILRAFDNYVSFINSKKIRIIQKFLTTNFPASI